jgi:hypothetical protein
MVSYYGFDLHLLDDYCYIEHFFIQHLIFLSSVEKCPFKTLITKKFENLDLSIFGILTSYQIYGLQIFYLKLQSVFSFYWLFPVLRMKFYSVFILPELVSSSKIIVKPLSRRLLPEIFMWDSVVQLSCVWIVNSF